MALRSPLATLFCLLATAGFTRAEEPDWSVRVTPYDQIYPALELSQARRKDGAAHVARDDVFGEGSGLIAVRLRAHRAGERITLSVSAPGLEESARVEAVLPQAGHEYLLRPPLAWRAQDLLAVASPRAATLTFELTRDGNDAGSRSAEISLRPLSEALYFVRDGNDAVDLSWIFAAYVDEHDAVVDRVLDMAIENGIVDKFDGYAGASPAAVYRQVWAVWQALSARGIRYSAADPGIARGPRVFSQNVRLLEQTWSDRSANCIDGSVLIASVLQRIGLRSFLVLVPGHAYVGFHVDAEGDRAAYLETTLLGAQNLPTAALPDFARDMPVEEALRLDISGFSAALASGRRRHARIATRFDRAHRPDYVWIDIGQARAFGIRPIETAVVAPPATGNAAPRVSGKP